MKILTRQRKKSEEGIALIGAIFLALFLTIMIGSVMLRADMQLKESDIKEASNHAFYAAEAGLDRAIFELRQNSKWGRAPEPLPTPATVELKVNNAGVDTTLGFYSLTLADGGLYNSWDSVWVKSVGYDESRRVPRTIIARVIVANPSRFLVLTLGNLKVGSGASVDFDVLGQDISFEVNQSMSSPDKDIDVDADVFYLRGVTGENDPAVHFSGNRPSKSPSISFAGVDTQRYRKLAQTLQTTGNGYYYNGNLNLDLRDLPNLNGNGTAPDIVFVDGDVNVIGNYESSVLVVASGNVYIKGEISSVANPSTGVHPQLGLLADQDVVIPDNVQTVGGNLTVEAFIMADGEGATSQGGFYAEGGKLSKGTLDFKGAIAVRGKGETAIDLNVFKERNYVFNSLLNSNRSIPFIPFIANVAVWTEGNPGDPIPPQ